MRICHVCNAEFDEDMDLCPVCGAEYRDDAEDGRDESSEKEVIENPVLAATVDNILTAEMYADALTDANIPYFTDEEQSGGMRMGFGGSFFAVQVFVDESNLAIAEELYENVCKNAEDFDFSDDDFDDTEDI